jgi:hypothetical protein
MKFWNFIEILKKLGDGVDLLVDGVDLLVDGVDLLGEGVDLLGEGVDLLGEGVDLLGDGVDLLGDGVDLLGDGGDPRNIAGGSSKTTVAQKGDQRLEIRKCDGLTDLRTYGPTNLHG